MSFILVGTGRGGVTAPPWATEIVLALATLVTGSKSWGLRFWRVERNTKPSTNDLYKTSPFRPFAFRRRAKDMVYHDDIPHPLESGLSIRPSCRTRRSHQSLWKIPHVKTSWVYEAVQTVQYLRALVRGGRLRNQSQH